MVAFTKNAMKWLANGKASPRIAARKSYKPRGFETVALNVPISDLAKGGVDVYTMYSAYEVTDEEAAALVAFVENGGGLLVAGKSTMWSGKVDIFTKFPGNKCEPFNES